MSLQSQLSQPYNTELLSALLNTNSLTANGASEFFLRKELHDYAVPQITVCIIQLLIVRL